MIDTPKLDQEVNNPYEEQERVRRSSINRKETSKSFFQSVIDKVKPDKKEKEQDQDDKDQKASAADPK